MTGDTPTITGSAAEATTAVPLDPRAIMATMGVSCATCRHWAEEDNAGKGICIATACDWPEADWGYATAASTDCLATRADHYCAMWERRA